MSNHGGKREGAGRPLAPAALAPVAITVRLPAWLAEWLREQGNQTETIKSALIRQHKLKQPQTDADSSR